MPEPEAVSMYIKLQDDVATVLGRVSRRERRHPRDQAALFIEDALRRSGALPLEGTASQATSTRPLRDDRELPADPEHSRAASRAS